jgi:hypothetical protein
MLRHYLLLVLLPNYILVAFYGFRVELGLIGICVDLGLRVK